MDIQEMISELDEIQKALKEIQAKQEKLKTKEKSKTTWKETWERVQVRLRAENPAVYSLLAECKVHYWPPDNYLTVWVSASDVFAFNNLRRPSSVNSILSAFEREGLEEVQVGIRKKKSSTDSKDDLAKSNFPEVNKERYTVLKHLRTQSMLGQGEVEDLLHIQHGWLSRIERGLMMPATVRGKEHLRNLAKLFDFHDDPIKLLETYEKPRENE